AETIKKAISSQTDYGEEYLEAHRRLYAGRLWINQLARWSVLHPRISSNLVELFRIFPAPLHYLTQKVVG
ncbi:MAG TPA: hypothetical protein VE242_00065, partial [Chthoniobacterales bacterium]|nr:hypothetical protein [Chthoniobacterales bacterium]